MTARRGRVDFDRINAAALANIDRILRQWLPGGRVQSGEYTALNPRRTDKHLGSFRINMRSGRWGDFVPGGASGGDLVSLGAYLAGCPQVEAARELAAMLGIEAGDG